MMGARRGRPPLPVSPAGGYVGAWCDAVTVEAVEQLAVDVGRSRADVVRAALRYSLADDRFLAEVHE